MSTLRIHLLGDFRLLWGDELLTGFYHPRQQALLAFLLLHRHAESAEDARCGLAA